MHKRYRSADGDGLLQPQLIGSSRSMVEVRRRILAVARHEVPVLIVGETGTGKDVCAQLIATISAFTPYVPLNCGAVPEGLVESELFGHAKGAFTGATHSSHGLVAKAEGGILFLDELGEAPMAVQVKLLRVLESGEYRAVGSTDLRRARFRLIAATNANIDLLVASGRFRSDLFYRLGAIRIQLPALRERPEDIGELAEFFLAQNRKRSHLKRLSMRAMELLQSLPWPGNVRQLRAVIQGSEVFAADASVIEVEHIMAVTGGMPSETVILDTLEGVVSLSEVKRRAEAVAVRDALRRAGGNRERAAELLGISQATLYRKLLADVS